jgi:hypothetical protein
MEGASKLFEDALDTLEDQLVTEFAGRSFTMVDLYHRHNIEKPFIKKNYKDALGNLLGAGRVVTDRVPRAGTFADGIVVTFPGKPVGRI